MPTQTKAKQATATADAAKEKTTTTSTTTSSQTSIIDTKKLNIYQKLAHVQRAVDIIQKDASGYGYKYVSEAELLPKINAEIYTMGLTLIPCIVPGTTVIEQYTIDKKKIVKGNQMEETATGYNIQAEMVFRWVNNDNPEEVIEVPWAMVGDQSGSSQAFGSALTYCNRYFLLKYFHCATVEDDPDAVRMKQEQAKGKSELQDILKQCDDIVQRVIAEIPNERDNIRQIVTECVDLRDAKGNLVVTGDYFKITKKARAMKLLNMLIERYGE